MVGIYKELEDLNNKLYTLEADLVILEKYGAEDKFDQCKAAILGIEEQIQLLRNRSFFCVECGHTLNKEERMYAQPSGLGGDGPVSYGLWDTYICPNCGYFTWDEDSRRFLGSRGSIDISDTRYRKAMDGHPKYDSDNRR